VQQVAEQVVQPRQAELDRPDVAVRGGRQARRVRSEESMVGEVGRAGWPARSSRTMVALQEICHNMTFFFMTGNQNVIDL
jgi:hypothetical protein